MLDDGLLKRICTFATAIQEEIKPFAVPDKLK